MEAQYACVYEDVPLERFPLSDNGAGELLCRSYKPVDLPFHPKKLFSKLRLLVASDNAKVYATTTTKGRSVVVKKIRQRDSPILESYVLLEIAMSFLNTHCKHVVDYHSCFKTKKNWWLVMEHMAPGPVAGVRAACEFKEGHIAFVLQSVLLALEYMHDRRRVHRDIKAHNVLVNVDGDVKLMDFGWAAQLTTGHPTTNLAVGSVFWMAPEVHAGQQYGTSIDVWSLGIMALELANGEPPYYNMDHESATLLLLLNDPPKLTNTDDHAWSSDMHDFVASCLQKQPAKRPSVDDLLRHPFVQHAASREEWRQFLRASFPKWPSLQRQ